MSVKRILAVLIVISVVALAVVIGRHVSERSAPDIVEALPDNVDIALTDLHYSNNENGVQRWVLDADRAEYQRQEGVVSIANIRLKFFESAAFSEVFLVADSGTFDQKHNEIELWGNVVVTTDRNDKLTLDRLHYREATRQLDSDGPVDYRSDRLVLTGKGLDLDLERGYLLVKEDVHTTLLPMTE